MVMTDRLGPLRVVPVVAIQDRGTLSKYLRLLSLVTSRCMMQELVLHKQPFTVGVPALD